MDIFPGWENYVERIRENWERLIGPEDTVVIAGDLSWGMSLEQALVDFRFLEALPGNKLIVKGNHDYWFSTLSKMNRFFEQNGLNSLKIIHNNYFRFLEALPGNKLIVKGNHDYWFSTLSKMNRFFEQNGLNSLKIIHNNCAETGEIAVCGSRGWMLDSAEEHNHKVYLREVGRLEASLKEGAKTDREPVAFLHYPPVYQNNCCEEMLEVMRRYGVKRCFYGHIHGSGAQYAFQGEYGGIQFRLVSADYLKFTPIQVISAKNDDCVY